jgi:predicted AlkP superfamily phosphohydrolase/phosphomutase
MSGEDRRKLLLIGIDGFSPGRLERFIDEGVLPGFASLRKDGSRVRLVSTLPATTPVAWASVVTGAPPSRTGIEGFLVHRPGSRLDRRVSGCYAHRCRAEPIWETATLSGKRSFVVKFPLSYPSDSATFRLDGAAGWGGLRCLHELASPAATVASNEPAAAGAPHFVVEECAADHVRVRWVIPTLWGGPAVTLWVTLTLASDGAAAASIAWGPDDSPVARLRRGEWSEPIIGRGASRQGQADFAFRVKALSVSLDPFAIHFFNTALHELRGHSVPAATWERYLEQVGPIEEQTEPSLIFSGGVDLDTQLEIFQMNARWLERVSAQILGGERWDLFMVQAHFIDWAHHLLEGAVDPRHPDYDPDKAPRYEAALRDSYRMADALVSGLRAVVPADTDVVVMGDHGQDLHHTTLHANEWLAAEGLLCWSGDGDEVDWTRTRAYAAGNYVYLNLAGREPDGVVSPSEAPALTQRIISGLLDLGDPTTRSRPVLIAGPKAEFERFGADGDGVGDVVFCMRSGFQARNDRGALFSQTRALREFTSGHDHFWPLDPRLHTLMFAAGPAFAKGYVHRRTEHVIDVAPTLCAALGMVEPAHCEGHAIRDILTDVDAH